MRNIVPNMIVRHWFEGDSWWKQDYRTQPLINGRKRDMDEQRTEVCINKLPNSPSLAIRPLLWKFYQRFWFWGNQHEQRQLGLPRQLRLWKEPMRNKRTQRLHYMQYAANILTVTAAISGTPGAPIDDQVNRILARINALRSNQSQQEQFWKASSSRSQTRKS